MTDAIATQGSGELALPSPVFRGAQMVKALGDYRELQAAMDASMPDQIMAIRGKTFRKKGYWRAIRVAFNLTVECERETREVFGVLENGTDNYVYSVTYRATTAGGVSVTGDGTCAAAEKQRGSMEATEHNVRSHAHTRAFNRAVSNLVGFGEVSAEEVERDEHGSGATASTPASTPTAEKRADGSALVTSVSEKTGTNKQGKPWTSYTVTLDDGRSGSTFDKTMAERARKAIVGKIRVQTTWEQKGQYTNLTGLEAVVVDAPTNGEGGTEPDPDARISDGDRKRLWQVARASGWSEPQVQAFLAEREIAETGHITNGAYAHIINSLKSGPPKAEGGGEQAEIGQGK